VRTLEGHGHWVNTMALNTDFVLRTGANDDAHRSDDTSKSKEEIKAIALKRWEEVRGGKPER
jgi:ribosome assembly protein 4